MQLPGLIITLAIVIGQLVKIPLGEGRGATVIDAAVLALCLFGLFRIKIRLTSPPSFIKRGLFFSLIALLSLILTPLHLTTNQYLFSFLYTLRFSFYILLGWLLLSNAFPSLKQNVNQTLILSGLILAVLGLLQFIFLPDLRFLSAFGWDPHFYRSASTFLDPNFLGAYLVLTLLLMFRSLQSLKNFKGFFFPLIIYLALMSTFSRSSYGMFLIGFLTLSFFKKSLNLASLTLILFLALLLSFQIYIRAVNQVTPLDRSQTASYRFSTWQQGFEIFLKNPSLGVGYNAYSFALKEYNLADEQFLRGHGSTTNDSSILHITATTGVLGFFAYILFLVSLCKAAWIKNPAFVAGVFGLLGHSIFVNSLFYPAIMIWIVLTGSNLDHEKSAK